MMPALPDTNHALAPRMPAYLISPRMAMYSRPAQEMFSPVPSPNAYPMANGLVLVRQMLSSTPTPTEQRMVQPINVGDSCQQSLKGKCQKIMLPIVQSPTPATLVVQNSKPMAVTGQSSTPLVTAGQFQVPVTVSTFSQKPMSATRQHPLPETVALPYAKSIAAAGQCSRVLDTLRQSPKSETAVGQFPSIAKLICSEKPVDLSMKPPKNSSSKTAVKLNTDKILSNQSSFKLLPKSSAGITPVSQPETKMRKTTYLLCRYCPFKAVSKEEIQNHILGSHPQRVVVVPKTFTCNYCTYVTSSELCMVRHLLSSHRSMILPSRAGTENLFSCSVCVFSADEPTMIHHMLDHYKDSTPCNYCSSCVDNSQASATRKRKTDSAHKTRLRSGKKKFSDLAKPKSSQNSSPSFGENPECKICHIQFSNKVELQTHEFSHASKISQCNDITKSSTTIKVSLVAKTLPSQAPSGMEKTAAVGTKDCTNQVVSPPYTRLASPIAEERHTQLSALSMQSDSQSIAVSNNVTSNISQQTEAVTVNSITSSTCTASILVSSTSSQDSVSVSTAMPVADLTPAAKKRKLAMKIFKNSSGVYETERSDTPKSISEIMCSGTPSKDSLKLCIQVPLEALPSQDYLPTTISEDHERDSHLPTTILDDHEANTQKVMRLQIPLNLLPKQQSSVNQIDSPSNVAELAENVEKPSLNSKINGRVSETQIITSINNIPLPSTISVANYTQTSQRSSSCALVRDEQHVSKEEGHNHSRKRPEDAENSSSHSSRQDDVVGETYNGIKPGKLMANMLKQKLSNIYLKHKQGDLSCNTSDPSKTVESLDSLTEHVKQHSSPKKTPPPNGTISETLKDGDFIDLTLEDSSDEESHTEQCCSKDRQHKRSNCSADLLSNSKRKALPAKNISTKITKVTGALGSREIDINQNEKSKTNSYLGNSEQLKETKLLEGNKSNHETQSVTVVKNVINTSKLEAKPMVAKESFGINSVEDSSSKNDLKIHQDKLLPGTTPEKITACTSSIPTDVLSENPLNSSTERTLSSMVNKLFNSMPEKLPASVEEKLLNSTKDKLHGLLTEKPLDLPAEKPPNSIIEKTFDLATENHLNSMTEKPLNSMTEKSFNSTAEKPPSLSAEKPHSSTSDLMVPSKDAKQGDEPAASVVTTASETHHDPAGTPLPQLPRRPKNVRRSTLRLPSMSGTSTLNALDSEDLVICPYCPKRLLFRLLPAHVQFHDSNCEHKCRDCNFATSFKWVLDTHVQCHKEVLHASARQITEIEWTNIKDGRFHDDEEVEMTQRLLIREEPASLTCKRQIARKTIAKKSISLPISSTRKASSSSNPAASSDIPAPLPVNKTKARCMEDFFAQILTDRVKPK
ncbi:serine-rich adhesin for platelets-like [Watersipora subatra]|uniref:serine-rich adhesin for platelets-like n=1 Tax=Watersipora subatra TaxID=2589382 RepID=UPI00355C2934